MPAKIIQTNNTPFRKVDLDPITLDIVENALRNARDEMDAVLFRTAMSPGIREQHDEFPLVANRDGKMVVGQFGAFINTFMQIYEGEIEEGDIFLTNDPYSCDGAVSHTPNWLVLMPIFKEGRVIGWSAMFGHMTDTGGRVPGSMPTDAQQIFEEGIIIPPLKLYTKGVLQQDILNLILHNCRMPQWNGSDLNSLIAGCRLAAARVTELSTRFGDDVYYSALNELLERTKRAVGDGWYDRTSVGQNFNPGSAAFFYGRLRDHPEFRMLVADRAQSMMAPGGGLHVEEGARVSGTPYVQGRNAPADLYHQRSSQIRTAVKLEYARWGNYFHTSGSVSSADWEVERARLLEDYFPVRTDVLLQQLRAATPSLYPTIDAPALSRYGGHVSAGFELEISASAGGIYYTLDGSDPRQEGGAMSSSALLYSDPVAIDGGWVVLKAQALSAGSGARSQRRGSARCESAR